MRFPKTALVLTVALLVTAGAVAQEKAKKKRGAVQLSPLAQMMIRMDRMRTALEELDLTEEQETKLAAVKEEFSPKMRAAFDELKEMVTDEQEAAVEAAMREARDAGKEGRALFVAVEGALKMTDAQKEKAGEIAEELRPVQRKMTQQVMGVLTAEQKETLKKKISPQRKPGAKAGAKKAGEKKAGAKKGGARKKKKDA